MGLDGCFLIGIGISIGIGERDCADGSTVECACGEFLLGPEKSGCAGLEYC